MDALQLLCRLASLTMSAIDPGSRCVRMLMRGSAMLCCRSCHPPCSLLGCFIQKSSRAMPGSCLLVLSQVTAVGAWLFAVLAEV